MAAKKTAAAKPTRRSTSKRAKGAASPKTSRRTTPKTPERASDPESLPKEVAEHYGPEAIALVADMVPADAPPTAFARLLVAGMRLGLDPMRREVYLQANRNRDGGSSEWVVVANRDGLLRSAEANPRFRGIDGDVLHAEDTFKRGAMDPDASSLRARAGIEHTSGHPSARGDLSGAWAVVEFANADGTLRPPVYFYAALDDYQPDLGRLEDDDPWKRFPGACVLRAAQAWTLRVGGAMSDVIGAEEMARAVQAPAAGDTAPTPADAMAERGEMDDVDRRILALYAESQDLAPTLWLRAKVNARLTGATDEQRGELAEEMDESLAPFRERREQQAARTAPADEQAATLRTRLAQLLTFDQGDLDADTQAELCEERDLVEAKLRALGFDPEDTEAPQDVDLLADRLAVLRDEYEATRAAARANTGDVALSYDRKASRLAVDVQRAEHVLEEAQAAQPDRK